MSNPNPNLDCHYKPDEAQKLMVSNATIVYAVMFSVLVCVVMRNFHRYVYLTGKTREPLVMIFYVLAFLTCLLRIVAFSIYSYTSRQTTASNIGYEVGNAVDCLASISTLNIGIFQCTSMQDLVIRVTNQVKQLVKIGKNERTSEVQHDTETYLKRMWFFALVISFISWVMGFYLVGLEVYYYNHNYSRETHVEDLNNYRREQGDIYCAFYVLLGVLTVLTNVLLNYTMNKHFGESLKEERKVFAWMFSIFTATYVVYAIYLIPQGYYDGLICQTYQRWIVLDLIVVIVDIVPIITILILHMKNYSKEEPAKDSSETQKKPRQKSVGDSNKSLNDGQQPQEEGFLKPEGESNGQTAERTESIKEEWEMDDTIEYEAEQLTGFELYQRMNPQQGGEYSNIIRKLGTRKFEDEDEQERGSQSWF